MGQQETHRDLSAEAVRDLTRAILLDITAFERMLREGAFESGVRRIGAEQEMFLVDRNWQPAPLAMKLIELAGDRRLTTELALFLIENNLEPVDTGPDMLTDFQLMLEEVVDRTDDAARQLGGHAVLAGILPTLTVTDLTLDNLTPRDRFVALNEAVMRQSGGRIGLRIQSTDELVLEHDNIMLEACNASFQVHYQVDPQDFAAVYNFAQAVAGPLLASSVNSPLLFGNRLWKETRIALFHQSVDSHPASTYPRERLRRVWFGDGWVRESASELFRENLLRFRPLLTAQIDRDPLAVLDEGGVPLLSALALHNGTVYRWNRPCYGVYRGRPHLRIECRYIPSGPSVIDEVANAAFWVGLVAGGPARIPDISGELSFDDARTNFYAAARHGLDTGFTWLGGERIPAPVLIHDRLLPLAAAGLRDLGVAETDVERYLGVIERRVATGSTGAHWLLRSCLALRERCPRTQRMTALTAAITVRAREGQPVHTWLPATAEESGRVSRFFDRVEHCMTTDLLTVREHDAIDVVAYIMNERGVRHVLVEDGDQRLVGVISYRSLLHMLATGRLSTVDRTMPVHEVMEREFLTVEPGTCTLEALRIMRDQNVTALPVVQRGRLVGIVSEHDFLPVLACMLEDQRVGLAPAAPADVAG